MALYGTQEEDISGFEYTITGDGVCIDVVIFMGVDENLRMSGLLLF